MKATWGRFVELSREQTALGCRYSERNAVKHSKGMVNTVEIAEATFTPAHSFAVSSETT